MAALPTINTVQDCTKHVSNLRASAERLLTDTATLRALFSSNHSLELRRLTPSDLQSKIARLATFWPHITAAASVPPSLYPNLFLLPAPHQHSTTPSPTTSAPLCTVPTPTPPSLTPTRPSTSPSIMRTSPSTPACPPLHVRLGLYEELYIQAIKNTVTKYDSKFISESGEYAVDSSLRSLHLPSSTRAVERVFSTVDWLFHVRSGTLRAILLSAYVASHEAPADTDCLHRYLLKYQASLTSLMKKTMVLTYTQPGG